MSSMADLYPKYYKSVCHLDCIDVYRVHQLFQVDDPSGCLQHASKKILLSGVRTGGKPKRKDIEEARDTLTRWLEMQAEDEHVSERCRKCGIVHDRDFACRPDKAAKEYADWLSNRELTKPGNNLPNAGKA